MSNIIDFNTASPNQVINEDLSQKINSLGNKLDYKTVSQLVSSLNSNLNVNDNADLAKRLIGICVKKKVNLDDVKMLDRKLHAQDHAFQIPENQRNFARWKKWHFDPQVFLDHYDFAKYLLDSPLGNQMKIYKEPFEIKGGVPGIKVEGEWMSFKDIQANFTIKFIPKFHEKFMVDSVEEAVYTFLDNGKGLQKHNPYTATTLAHPIAQLTDEEYERTLEVAQKFVHKGEEGKKPNPDRTFIFQIVSSYVNDSWYNNLMELLYRRKHPWIRVICGRDNEEFGTKKGQVFEIGFGWTKPSKLPAKTTKGRFRTEDLWNYNTKAVERVVTNIPITAEDAQGMLKYILNFHTKNIDHNSKSEDKIAFNLWAQNCSAFVHYIAKVASVAAPTKIFLTDLIKEISPDWIKAVGRTFAAVGSAVGSGINKATFWVPNIVKSPIKAMIVKVTAIVFGISGFFVAKPVEVVSVAAGGLAGEPGRAFTDNPEEEMLIGTRLSGFKNFFSLKRFYYHLPGVLQQWQREQPSTVIYKNPVKLSIVPPASFE